MYLFLTQFINLLNMLYKSVKCLSSRFKQSPGRLFVFIVILTAFFSIVASVIGYIVDSINIVPDFVENEVGSPGIMLNLVSMLRLVTSWIREIMINRYGLAILFIISVIYMIITER